LYAGIAAIVSFEFTIKEVFIMAVMLSFSHNLIVESAVATRVGVKWWLIVGIRVGLALKAAFIINLLWQGGRELAQFGLLSQDAVQPSGWVEIAFHGVQTAAIAIFQLALIVIPLMILIHYLRDIGCV